MHDLSLFQTRAEENVHHKVLSLVNSLDKFNVRNLGFMFRLLFDA